MVLFEVTSIGVIGGIVIASLLCAPIVQNAWHMRILIASYIALCITLLVPEKFVFTAYMNMVYYCGVMLLLLFIGRGRMYHVAQWSADRFSVWTFGFSVVVWFFIVTCVCFLLPFSFLDGFFTKEVYDFLVTHIFYFALVSLVYALLFARNI